jgi:hypothetical protein
MKRWLLSSLSWLGSFVERLVRCSQFCEDYCNLWRSIVMEEECTVRSTRFCMNMNKEPKKQIFVDVAQEGVNHGIFVSCV